MICIIFWIHDINASDRNNEDDANVELLEDHENLIMTCVR